MVKCIPAAGRFFVGFYPGRTIVGNLICGGMGLLRTGRRCNNKQAKQYSGEEDLYAYAKLHSVIFLRED